MIPKSSKKSSRSHPKTQRGARGGQDLKNIVKSRKGDSVDEFLIGPHEIDYTYKIKKNKKIYFVIDLNKKARNPLKKVISSNNSKKFSKLEISKLIRLGMY